jgi:glucokinase
MSQPPRLIAGVDVGGTKIAAGLATRDGRVIASARIATPASGDAVIEAIADLLRRILSDAGVPGSGVASLGIAVPAVIDRIRGNVLWAPNIPGWDKEGTAGFSLPHPHSDKEGTAGFSLPLPHSDKGTPLAAPISHALGIATSLHYDGHAWAVGEWWLGAAKGALDAALLAVGTGIGGGLILGGRLHRGRIGVAGAIGWWVTDRAEMGPRRRETHGQLESVASGPAIARAAGKQTADEAFQAARQGEPAAVRAVSEAAAALGAAVANLVSLLDPEVVVLAGGVFAGGGDLLLPRVQEIVSQESQPQIAAGVRIVPAALGEDAPWLGAARLGSDSDGGRRGH